MADGLIFDDPFKPRFEPKIETKGRYKNEEDKLLRQAQQSVEKVKRQQSGGSTGVIGGANEAKQSFMGSYGISTQGGSKDPLVYIGAGRGTMPIGMSGAGTYDFKGAAATKLNTLKLSQVADQYYSWDSRTKNKFLTNLNLAGYDTSSMKDEQIASLWGAYAQQSANYLRSGQKLTPWDILAKDRAQREEYLNTPRTVTQTSKSFDMSTRGDAQAIFLAAAQQLVGRDPTKGEISAFQKALNKYEKANPTITKTTTNYLGDEVTGQESTTTGGVKDGARNVMAMEDIKADPEYGAYQAATTYFDALMEMIGGG